MCKKKGAINFNCPVGYPDFCSKLICHDPKTFCDYANKKITSTNDLGDHCDYTCLRNGRCHPGETPMSDDQMRQLDLIDGEALAKHYEGVHTKKIRGIWRNVDQTIKQRVLELRKLKSKPRARQLETFTKGSKSQAKVVKSYCSLF